MRLVFARDDLEVWIEPLTDVGLVGGSPAVHREAVGPPGRGREQQRAARDEAVGAAVWIDVVGGDRRRRADVERLSVTAAAHLRPTDDRGAHRLRARLPAVLEPAGVRVVCKEEDRKLTARQLPFRQELVADVLAAPSWDPEVARRERLPVVLDLDLDRRVPRVRDEDRVAARVEVARKDRVRRGLRDDVLAADGALCARRRFTPGDALRTEARCVGLALRDRHAVAVDDRTAVCRAGLRAVGRRERRRRRRHGALFGRRAGACDEHGPERSDDVLLRFADHGVSTTF